MNKEITKLLQETIFNLYQKDYPKIVEFVRQGLAIGETPKSIHRFLQKKLGKNSASACHASLIAEYLLSHQN